MEIYILRHAIAAPQSRARYPDDSRRPLTAEGRKKMRGIAQAMKHLKLVPDLILSSPYLRASQTAEIAAKILGKTTRLKYSEHLRSGGEAHALIKDIQKLPRYARRIVLVGHEPYLSKLISTLVTGSAHGAAITLKKGGLCKLTVRRLLFGRCATLEWLLTPKILLAIR